jgi:hypothetical protein
MEGTVAVSAGHTSCFGFEKSEKKVFIRAVKQSFHGKENPQNSL